jgi:putative transposase
MVEGFINHYNNVSLHSAIGYITPVDKLNGSDQEIFKERDRKLEKARELRKK